MSKVTIPLFFPPPAVCEGGRSLRDHAGRLLRGVGGVRGDRPGLVGVAGEEDEAVAGAESRRLEVPRQPAVTPHPCSLLCLSFLACSTDCDSGFIHLALAAAL